MYRKRIDFKPGDDQKEVKLLFHIALTWNLPKDLHLLLAWFRSRQFFTCLYFKAIAYFLSNTLLEHAKRHACAAWGIYTVIRRCNTLLRQWHHRFKWEKWLKACPNCYAWNDHTVGFLEHFGYSCELIYKWPVLPLAGLFSAETFYYL